MKKMWIALMALMLLGLSAVSAEQMSFPEERQQTGTEVKALDDLPKTTYTRQEIWLENEGQRIYGIAYIPDVEGKMPLAILSHGLGGSYSSCLAEAEQYASHGVAAYAFDFRGGGGSRSDGSTTQMSVMTEVSRSGSCACGGKDLGFCGRWPDHTERLQPGRHRLRHYRRPACGRGIRPDPVLPCLCRP